MNCIGRLVFRALWDRPGIEIVHVNDPAGDAHGAAHLLEFDYVHVRCQHGVVAQANGFVATDQINRPITFSQAKEPWAIAGANMVLDFSGNFKTPINININIS